MRTKIIVTAGLAAITAMMLSGCAATQVTAESCQVNQNATVTGAFVGAGAGAVAGGLAAAMARQNGGAAAAIVLGAAALGSAVGAIIGHEHDMACHQLALRQALDAAMAKDEELRQQAAESAAAAQRAEAAKVEAEQQLREAAVPVAPTPPLAKPAALETNNAVEGNRPVQPLPEHTPTQTPVYETVAWADKMTNNSGVIAPLANVSGATTNQVCMTFSDTQTINGETKTVLGKACRGSDGDWHPL